MNRLSEKALELQELVNTVSDSMCDLAARTEEISAAAEAVDGISKNVREAMKNLSDKS